MISLDNNQNPTTENVPKYKTQSTENVPKYKDIDRSGQKNIYMQIVAIRRVE